MEIPRNAGSDASAKMSDRDECALQKGPLMHRLHEGLQGCAADVTHIAERETNGS